MKSITYLRWVIGRVLLLFCAGVTAWAAPELESHVAVQLRSPLDYQVHQRMTPTGGNIALDAAVVPASPAAAILEARLVGAPGAPDWVKIGELDAGQKELRAVMSAPAGGWYRLELRLRAQTELLSEAAVEHVGVGEVFVIAGQSNSANHGSEKQQAASARVAAFSGNAWSLAHDPQPGASGNGGSFIPAFGDAMAARFNVPIGIVAAGVGATSIREWMPQGVRFANPPTLTNRVVAIAAGEWESDGALFASLVHRINQLGPQGFRALLWHQGESDANQQDPSRTLPGEVYRTLLEQLIRNTQRDVGWPFPWFVAQASYHTPNDPGSPDIRAAQRALWQTGVALQGPDTDALGVDFRDGNGKGVHFSALGLREHGLRWCEKVAPWLETQLAKAAEVPGKASKPKSDPPLRIALPGESLSIEGRPGFLFLPDEARRTKPQPWIFYAPTLPPYPDQAERWMHEQFLAAGVAVAGLDVGEAYGSPTSHRAFDGLYRELVQGRGFAEKPCLLGRSRGGLWVSSWAIANPNRVAGLAGIYPVFDFRTYPGLTNAAPAYGLSPAELAGRLAELDPILRIDVLARAKVPALLIHGDMDTVVPLKENSQEFVRRYREADAEPLVTLIILNGQGHNFFEGFFHSQALVDFVIRRARAGAQ